MNNIKTIVLSVILIISINVIAQQQTMNDIPDGANLVNLNDSKYQAMSFGKIINLYEGKVVYLDFWASWCGPCKKEMPHSLKMQEHFKGKDVVFIYMSSDRNPKAWQNSIGRLQITGENYLANAKVWKEYNSMFEVKFIPRYVLIDKEGRVVNAMAKRPSNPESIADIEKLL